MGGMFSTRWGSHRRKSRVDECRSFAVAELVGDHPPAVGRTGQVEWRSADRATVVASIVFAFLTAGRVALSYRWGDDGKEVVVPFDLATVPTPNGGLRYLAVCPLVVGGVACRRRTAQLYLPPGSPYFGCRWCHRLTYRSRQGHDKRVSALLRSGTLPELAANPAGLPIQTLGLILMAIQEHDRRLARALKRFDPKPKPRRRKPK